jgi:hypothetical protein
MTNPFDLVTTLAGRFLPRKTLPATEGLSVI